MEKLYFDVQTDCEAMQPSINDKGLGERAIHGLTEIFKQYGCKGSFMVIPGDMKAYSPLLREMQNSGHEIGVHVHPVEQGYQEFLGVYGYEAQLKIIGQARDVFTEMMGFAPKTFTPGYGSANDSTFPALYDLGFRQGLVSVPTRDLPQCACVWGSSPRWCSYAHRYNRCLEGDLDFVNVPGTLDPESRMWGGHHPQDLRIELVDAKNHYYTVEKAIKAQISANVPVKYIKALTHNTFEYSDKGNFRRETLCKVIEATQKLAKQNNLEFTPANTATIAEKYRETVKLPDAGIELKLDIRGR